MTREEFAAKIRWPWVIWSFGFVNVTAMLPQLWKLITTQVTEGLSVPMFLIYLSTQIAFALDGFFKRNNVLLVCLGLSALINLIVISLILYFRYGT